MQAVPLGFYLFLVELAAGGILVTVALDWDGEVSPGFLFLNGVFLLAFAAAGIWLRSVLPAAKLVPYPTNASILHAEPAAWASFALLTAVYLLCLKLERRRAGRVAGSIAAMAALGALGVSAAGYLPPKVPAVLVPLSLLAGAAALGTVWSGMMLGHWYLVTPLLSPRPLLRINAALVAVLVGQAALVVAIAFLGANAGQVPVAQTWPFWLRALVGIILPLPLCYMIWRTARVRSMMSATGLLYIALGAILSGEILGRVLFFVNQTPV